MPPAIEAGRYLCLQTQGLVPWMIRKATRSDYDHTAIVLPRQRVAEAEAGGVIISPLSKYAGCYAAANLNEPMTAAQLERVWRKAESMVGTPYNFAAIGEDALQAIHVNWQVLLHIAQADHELDCSQLAALCGTAAIPALDWLCSKATYCEVTPADLARRPGVVPVTIEGPKPCPA